VRKEDRTADITWGRGMQAPQEEEDKERVFSSLKKEERKRGRTCSKRKGEEAKSEKIVKERIDKEIENACNNFRKWRGRESIQQPHEIKSRRTKGQHAVTSEKRIGEERACITLSKEREREHAVTSGNKGGGERNGIQQSQKKDKG
jgi:hypothetical protein